ncbi:hypothetical protein [Hydrogenivirga sp.]
MAVKVRLVTYGGRNYIPVGKGIVVTPHALHRADERGVERTTLLEKLWEEREELLNLVASRIGSGEVRGVFFLTFPDGKRGKVLWEIMSPEGRRLESVEEVEETTDAVVVVYTYLHSKQRFYRETSFSKCRRERDNRLSF